MDKTTNKYKTTNKSTHLCWSLLLAKQSSRVIVSHCSDLKLIGVCQHDDHTHRHTHLVCFTLSVPENASSDFTLSLHPAFDGTGVDNRSDLGGKKAGVETGNRLPLSAQNGCRDLTSNNV